MGAVEEIRLEQQHMDRARARLEELRAGAASIGAALLDQGQGGLLSDRVERDARADYAARVRAGLAIGDLPLCFGRIDTDGHERFHIGRLGVLDRDGEPLVVDWRTPVAEPFYRATPGERMGVRSRRHIRMRATRVLGVDDESLVDPSQASGLVGEAALLASLTRARTGRMGDIVATIQREQDVAIRAPLREVLVVQGGPGTGKTAVALHRAAYLLYAHHFPLAHQGVLVIGPNPVFCRYVEDVLPGLGQTGVRVATAASLGHRSAGRRDPDELGAAKGSLEMVSALRAAIAAHEQPVTQTCHVGLGVHRLAVTAGDSAALIEAARAAGPHNEARAVLEKGLLRHLLARVGQANRRARESGLEVSAATASRRWSLGALRRSPEVRSLADRLWPVLSAEQVVDEALRAVGLPGLDVERLSEHDVALIDEADHQLGRNPPAEGRPAPRPAGMDETMERTLSAMGLLPDCPACGAELSLERRMLVCGACGRSVPARTLLSPEALRQISEITERVEVTRRSALDPETLETFGHLIVDEAQDLTPLQWRMLSRRCPSGSMTLVGDLGQSKYPWSLPDWKSVAALAAPDRPVRVLELSVNYRTPAEIMDLAARVLDLAHPGARPPESVRRSGERPLVVAVERPADLAERVLAVSRQEAERVAPGTVAIIRAGAGAEADASVLEEQILELDVAQARGLEFDSVVLVEPADYPSAELYVALTRATRRLVLVHAAPLPEPLVPRQGSPNPPPGPAPASGKP